MNRPAYRFVTAHECAMCGSTADQWKVLGRRLDRTQGWRPKQVAGAATTVVRCRSCSLVFPQPMPVPADLADHYELPPEDYFNERRTSRTGPVFQSQIQTARRLLSHARSPKALDVGAGVGKVMNELEAGGFEAWGLEPSSSFRHVALNTAGLDHDRIAAVSIEEADYPTESFDLVTFGAVLEHLPGPGRAIEKALGWLKSGGLVHAEVPSSEWLVGRMLNSYFRLTGAGLVTNLSPMHPPYHLYEFTVDSFRLHGQRVGYSLAEVTRSAGDPMAPGLLGRMLRTAMQWTGTGMQLTVWLRSV